VRFPSTRATHRFFHFGSRCFASSNIAVITFRVSGRGWPRRAYVPAVAALASPAAPPIAAEFPLACVRSARRYRDIEVIVDLLYTRRVETWIALNGQYCGLWCVTRTEKEMPIRAEDVGGMTSFSCFVAISIIVLDSHRSPQCDFL
jgi:hypothetical protein